MRAARLILLLLSSCSYSAYASVLTTAGLGRLPGQFLYLLEKLHVG